MCRQVYDLVNSSLALSALFAALPLVVLFVLLGVFKVKAWIASLVALAVTLGIAVLIYPMPLGQALDAGAEGALFGLFPIMLIVVNAIWIYNMTRPSGSVTSRRPPPLSPAGSRRVDGRCIDRPT